MLYKVHRKNVGFLLKFYQNFRPESIGITTPITMADNANTQSRFLILKMLDAIYPATKIRTTITI